MRNSRSSNYMEPRTFLPVDTRMRCRPEYSNAVPESNKKVSKQSTFYSQQIGLIVSKYYAIFPCYSGGE